jgi:hypothetical protein
LPAPISTDGERPIRKKKKAFSLPMARREKRERESGE